MWLTAIAQANRSPIIVFMQHHRQLHAHLSNSGKRGSHARGKSIPPPPPPLPADSNASSGQSKSASNSKRGSLRNQSAAMPKRHSEKYPQTPADAMMSKPKFASPTPQRPAQLADDSLNGPLPIVPSPPPLQPPPPRSEPPRRPISPPPSRSHSRQNTPIGSMGLVNQHHLNVGLGVGSASAPHSPAMGHPSVHLRNPRSKSPLPRSPSPGPPPTSSAPPVPTRAASVSRGSTPTPTSGSVRLHLAHGAHPAPVQLPGLSSRGSAYPVPSAGNSPAVSRPPSAQERSQHPHTHSNYPPRPLSTPPAIPSGSPRAHAHDSNAQLPPTISPRSRRSPSPKRTVPLRLNPVRASASPPSLSPTLSLPNVNNNAAVESVQQHQQYASSPGRATLTLRREKHAKKQAAVKLRHVFDGGPSSADNGGGSGGSSPQACNDADAPRTMSRR